MVPAYAGRRSEGSMSLNEAWHDGEDEEEEDSFGIRKWTIKDYIDYRERSPIFGNVAMFGATLLGLI